MNSQTAAILTTHPAAMMQAREARKRARTALRPPPKLTVSSWADSFRRLSPESSAEPGRWYTTRAEYLRGVMDAATEPGINTVVLMSSAQIGKTEFLLNVLGYFADQDPSPCMLIQPTLEMAEAFSKDRVTPMIRDTPVINKKMTHSKKDTLLHKTFYGGHFTLAGANSPASLASRPIRIVLCDECDRYPMSAGTEGDPITIVMKRSTTFWNRKLILTSTPTIKGASRIEAAFMEGDQRFYWVPCHECGVMQILRWEQVKWEDPAEPWYECIQCKTSWLDAQRWSAVRKGQWRASKPTRNIASFHLNEIYSSWVSLRDTVDAFIKSAPFPERKKVWVNTSLGMSYEEDGEQFDPEKLKNRREAFTILPDGRMVLPKDCAILTAGVDVQEARIEVEVVGWGLGEESWSIDYRVFYGDPSADVIWDEVDAYLLQLWMYEDGLENYIRAVGIDTGGSHTQSAYKFCRPRFRRPTPDGGSVYFFALKGVAGKRPIWPQKINYKSGGLVVYGVGVDTAKDIVMSRFRVSEFGPGYVHLPKNRDDDWCEGACAEVRRVRYHHGYPKPQWEKIKPRNEPLDNRVYATCSLMGLLTVTRTTIEGEIQELRRIRGITDPIPVVAPVVRVSEILPPPDRDEPPMTLRPGWFKRDSKWFDR